MKPVALIDLDGTLADFDGAMQRDYQKIASPSADLEYELDPDNEDRHEHIQVRKRLIKRQPNWWFELEPLTAGFQVVDMLRQLEFRLHVLTRGPKNLPSAWEQKVRWVRHYLTDASVTITLDKALVYGRVLVDDWPDYITPWLEHRPRGLVVMPAQRWNVSFPEHSQVVRYVAGENDAEVFARLKAQRERTE